MSVLKRNQPIWRIRGLAPDGRRLTCFVNGDTEDGAVAAAKAEGMCSVSETYLVKPEDIERWEAAVKPGVGS
jgi:hypothetical protein